MKIKGTDQAYLKKISFEYSPLGMSFSKAFEKDKLKVVPEARVISIIIAFINFMNFTKGMMNLKRCH